MKLKTLQITNFRCFESLEMDLHEQLTVIVAKNGQGKSSVLDAIRIGLWWFIGSFDLAKNSISYNENHMRVDDILMKKEKDGQLVRQLPCKIKLKSKFNIDLIDQEKNITELEWYRIRKSEDKNSNLSRSKSTTTLIDFAHAIQSQIRTSDSPDITLPAVGYYGTGRLWGQKKLKPKATIEPEFSMRLFGYRDCLDPGTSYKVFAEWFTWAFECYREDQIKQAEKGVLYESDSKWKETILVIQQAINAVLEPETGWHNLEYSVSYEKSLTMSHPEHGKLKVEQLSDGIRGILAMVGDIAYRCIKLNPNLGINAAIETQGVVMIDEIELHLHPAWQQTILSNLCKAFPKIQFIITTHSPQVISTVASEQIRILDDGKVYSAEAGTQGAESSRILKRIFGVDPRPQHDPNVKLLNEYLDLVYADKWDTDTAKDMRTKLDAIYQTNEPALTAADLHIENRQWELGLEDEEN